MATKTAVQDGFIENGIVFGLAASTPTVFTANDTLAVGTQALYCATAQTIGTITSTAGTGSLTLCNGAQVTTTACACLIKHAGRVIATSALGSPTTGPGSGGSVPGVFVAVEN